LKTGQDIEPAEGGNNTLTHLALAPVALGDLQVLIGTGGFDAEEHGNSLSPRTNTSNASKKHNNYQITFVIWHYISLSMKSRPQKTPTKSRLSRKITPKTVDDGPHHHSGRHHQECEGRGRQARHPIRVSWTARQIAAHRTGPDASPAPFVSGFRLNRHQPAGNLSP
jgi:hypothetical protein